MKMNFSLPDAVAVQSGSEYYDLHNCFDLVGFTVSFTDRKVEVKFGYNDRLGCKKIATDLIISFLDVDYIDVSSGVLRNMIRDISELGYKKPDDFDHDWLMSEGQKSETDHFFIRMAGDEYIRVHGVSAVLTYEKRLIS